MATDLIASRETNQAGGEQPLRLLVVEDSNFDRILLQNALEESGLNATITQVKRLHEALAMRGLALAYDVMLLDLNFPDTTWSQTLDHLRTEIDALPVVVLTGMEDEAIGLQAIRAGAQDYLVKGEVDGTVLKRTLRYAIERFRLLTDLQVARKHEWQLANLDALTGLPNRRLFEERLGQALNEAKRNNALHAIILADLDRFKPINDSMGHSIGDVALVQVAQRLRACVRAEDTVARLGGDEFILLVRDLQQPEDAAVVAKKVIAQLSEALDLSGNSARIGASLGIALAPTDGERPDQLIRYADLAMYKAKTAGGNDFSYYSEELGRSAVERMTLESELRSAIGANQLTLYYQPVVSLPDNRVVAQEVLVRWPSARLGFLSPGAFVPFAELSDLIFQLDDWVLNQACKAAALWPPALDDAQPVAVNINLTRRHFRQPQQLVSWVTDCIDRTGIAAARIVLEITETAFIDASHEVTNALAYLRERGVKIAIDDFGVGYSSLNTLRDLPVDILKIDRSFLAGVPGNPRNTALARAIIQLGKTLELKVVAEGVETQRQETWLVDQGCQYAQGYRLARPQAQPLFELGARSEVQAT